MTELESAGPHELSRRDTRKVARQEKHEAKVEQKEADKFADSPAGQAREARAAGEMFYQITLPVAARRTASGMTSGLSGINPNGSRSPISSHAVTLGQIEAEGWRLDNVGYVYEETGQVSRDKLLSSGQRTATMGRILGVYLFRAA